MRSKMVVMIEEVTFNSNEIKFKSEFSLESDSELAKHFLNNREMGFPECLSTEVVARISPFCNPKQDLHSWIRMFGVQSTYLQYRASANSQEDTVRSLLELIGLMNGANPEPRLIFWFEDEISKEA